MIDDAEKVLVKREVRPTSIRLVVLAYLLERSKAQSLKDIEQGLPDTDRSSIFRSLKVFEEKNVIHSILDGSGSIKYAVCAEGCNCDLADLHYHFYCTNCDLTYCLLDNPIPIIQLPQNFIMKEANMVVKGLCDQCC